MFPLHQWAMAQSFPVSSCTVPAMEARPAFAFLSFHSRFQQGLDSPSAYDGARTRYL